MQPYGMCSTKELYVLNEFRICVVCIVAIHSREHNRSGIIYIGVGLSSPFVPVHTRMHHVFHELKRCLVDVSN